MTRRAVIMAGGKGTRLRPYTDEIPKPLVRLGDTPVLEIVLRQLARAGFERATLAIDHRAEMFEELCGDGTRFGLRVSYSREQTPLGTIGPLKLIADLPDDFLVINADILTDMKFDALLDWHCRTGSEFTIAAVRRSVKLGETLLETDAAGRLTRFREKPELQQIVSSGVYALRRTTLDLVPESAFGYDELVLKMMRLGRTIHVRTHDGYWVDIGLPHLYQQATADFVGAPERFLYAPEPA